MKKITKEEILRARCDSSLKRDVAQVALLQQLDEADIIRIACAKFVQQFKSGSAQTTQHLCA